MAHLNLKSCHSRGKINFNFAGDLHGGGHLKRRNSLCIYCFHYVIAVSFYCVKQRGGYSLMVSLDRKDTTFSNIGAVNAEGEISPECGYQRFQWGSRGVLRLNASIQNVSGLLESDCPAETVRMYYISQNFDYCLYVCVFAQSIRTLF